MSREKTFQDFGIEVYDHRGGEVATKCPQCSSSRKKNRNAKCLSVNVDKGVWNCHHCGWAGTLKTGAHRAELHWQKPAFTRPVPLEPKPLDATAQWFDKRGITSDVTARYGITKTKVYFPQVEDWRECIAFPYYRNGTLENHKYRGNDSEAGRMFRQDAGAEQILYGYDDINDSNTIVVEGELDKLAFAVAGIFNVVSVPNGAPAPNTKDYASKFDFLDDERLERVQQWIIAVDNDEPGKRLEQELGFRFGRDRCLRVTWPDGCKDANDVLVKHGRDALRDCLAEAQPYPLQGVIEAADIMADVRRLYAEGLPKGVSTGWDDLDPFYTVRPCEFTVVTGIPNSGKSNWLDDLCVHLAKLHGWKFAMFSPENQPVEDHAARLAEKYLWQGFGEGTARRMSPAEMENGMAWVNRHFFWILPEDDAEWTLDVVLDRAKSLIRRKGVRGIVIDPWNEMEHLRPSQLTETEYISQSLKRFRQFARLNDVHAWMVAHPMKLKKGQDGTYPVPTLYDISGSAHWRNKADNGICVWRDFSNPENRAVQVYVQKIRFKQIGQLGVAELIYNRHWGTYHDPRKAHAEIPARYMTGQPSSPPGPEF